MSEFCNKYLKLAGWHFEIKTIKAIKVDRYGEPYTCIANCTINGDTMYIDGMLAKDDDEFNRKDFIVFYKFCQNMGLRKVVYDRYINGKLEQRIVDIEQSQLPIDNEGNANSLETLMA